MKISRNQILIISLIWVVSLTLVTINYTLVLSIASWFTAIDQSKDIPYFQNIEKVNSVLIQTKGLEEVTNKSIENYYLISILFSIIAIPAIILAGVIKKIISDINKTIEDVVPRWEIMSHSKVMIPATIGIFVAISLNYYSSLSYITSLRKQTIINTIALIQDSRQPEVLNNLLITYIQNNFSEYWITAHGFLYFIFALIFPIAGSLWYYRRKSLDLKLNFWIIVLFVSAAFTIPFWIVFSLL